MLLLLPLELYIGCISTNSKKLNRKKRIERICRVEKELVVSNTLLTDKSTGILTRGGCIISRVIYAGKRRRVLRTQIRNWTGD